MDAPSQSTKDPEQGQELIMRLLGSWDDLGQHPDGETRCTWRLKLHYVQALRVIQPKVIHVEYMPQARDVRSSLGKNTLYCSGVRLDFHTALWQGTSSIGICTALPILFAAGARGAFARKKQLKANPWLDRCDSDTNSKIL